MSVEVKLTFPTTEEAVAFLTRSASVTIPKPGPIVAQTAASVTSEPTATAKADQAAAETKVTKPVKAKAPEADAKPADTKPETPVELTGEALAEAYKKSGLPEKFASYMGVKDSEGYADRRVNLVTLLDSFGVKKGTELKASQFAAFGAGLDELAKALTKTTEEALG